MSVSIESIVQISPGTPARHEVDRLNNQAALYFGESDEYVLMLACEDLRRVIELAARALSDLDGPEE